jgi:hypothetical protein
MRHSGNGIHPRGEEHGGRERHNAFTSNCHPVCFAGDPVRAPSLGTRTPGRQLRKSVAIQWRRYGTGAGLRWCGQWAPSVDIGSD